MMDPDETLRQAREAHDKGDMLQAAYWYAVLDGWLTRGGFPPAEWRKHES